MCICLPWWYAANTRTGWSDGESSVWMEGCCSFLLRWASHCCSFPSGGTKFTFPDSIFPASGCIQRHLGICPRGLVQSHPMAPVPKSIYCMSCPVTQWSSFGFMYAWGKFKGKSTCQYQSNLCSNFAGSSSYINHVFVFLEILWSNDHTQLLLISSLNTNFNYFLNLVWTFSCILIRQ